MQIRDAKTLRICQLAHTTSSSRGFTKIALRQIFYTAVKGVVYSVGSFNITLIIFPCLQNYSLMSQLNSAKFI